MADAATNAREAQAGMNGEKKKQPSKAQQRKQTMNLHKALRFAIQIVFFIFAPGVFASAMNGIHYIANQIGAMQLVEFSSFIVILVATLGYTILFGRFFCGYACAFGTMGDVLYLIGTPLRRLIHLDNKPVPPKLAAVLRWVKVVLLVAIFFACFTGVWGQVSDYNPWTPFGLIVGGTFSGLNTVALVLLVLIMVFQLLFERSFCKFFCPMGATFSLMPVLPISQFGRKRKYCGRRWCNQCIKNCPADMYPDKGSVQAGECFMCGRCADVCPVSNVNLLLIEEREKPVASDVPTPPVPEPVRVPVAEVAAMAAESKSGENPDVVVQKKTVKKRAEKPKAKVRFKGSGIAYVLVRAALLLLLCWLIGATRFLPEAAAVLPFALPWM